MRSPPTNTHDREFSWHANDSQTMSALGHLAVGIAASRFGMAATRRTRKEQWATAFALMALAVAPDLDILAEQAGLAEHRGASHSLAFAAIVAMACFGAAAVTRRPAAWWGLAAFTAIASHGILDLFSPGPAVELLWPLTEVRIVAPIRPLPSPPLSDLLTVLAARTWALEALIFLPVVLVAFAHRRSR